MLNPRWDNLRRTSAQIAIYFVYEKGSLKSNEDGTAVRIHEFSQKKGFHMWRSDYQRILAVVFGLLGFSALSTESIENRLNAADFAFPTEPARWINSQPISQLGIQNKAAYLLFFEES